MNVGNYSKLMQKIVVHLRDKLLENFPQNILDTILLNVSCETCENEVMIHCYDALLYLTLTLDIIALPRLTPFISVCQRKRQLSS